MKLLFLSDWENSASKADGISQQVEAKVRHEVYNFAREMEKYLNNQNHPNFQNYFQKALSIFHRFSHQVLHFLIDKQIFKFQVSFRNFDRYIYIVASLFLSAKDEDSFNWSLDRYVENFLICCARRQQEQSKQNQNKTKQNYQVYLYPVQLPKIYIPDQQNNDQKYQFQPELKKIYCEKICDAESHILKMLGYDLDIIVPQVYYQEARKHIKLVQGDSEKFWATAQNYLADLFCTTIILYYQPKIICMAALYLSQNYLKIQIEDLNEKVWYQYFDKDQPTFEDQMKNQDKPAIVEQTTIEDIVAICKNFDENIKLIKY